MLKPPTQIIEENPGLKKVWTPSDIGYLFKLKLVRGKKILAGKRTAVEERDVIRLFSSRIL